MSSGEQLSPTAAKQRLWSVVGLLGLAAVLSLQVWFPNVEAGQINDSYSVEVGGRNALYQFVKRRIPYVARSQESLVAATQSLEVDDVLCLLGPARYPTAREWEAVLEWVHNGGHLLIAARWDDPEFEIPSLKAKVFEPNKKSNSKSPGLEKLFGKTHEPRAISSDRETVRKSGSGLWTPLLSQGQVDWRSEGVVEAPGGEVLLQAGTTEQVVRVAHGAGQIVIASSDYIFSNASLAEQNTENGALAVKLLQAAGADQGVVFDESLNTTGTPRVVGVLLSPLLRPIAVQLLVVLVVFGWRGNRRFGSLLPQSASARHDIADHTNALGNLYYKVKDGAGVLRSYLEQLRGQLRLRFIAGHEERQLAALAQRTGLTSGEIFQLLTGAEKAAKSPVLSRREAAAQIRALAKLRCKKAAG